MIEIKVEQIHCGQYKRYGDFFRVWKLETDIKDEKTILEYCFKNLRKKDLPHSVEWHKNVRFGGEKSSDANYYFAGYYNLEKKENHWVFTVCEPYCD